MERVISCFEHIMKYDPDEREYVGYTGSMSLMRFKSRQTAARWTKNEVRKLEKDGYVYDPSMTKDPKVPIYVKQEEPGFRTYRWYVNEKAISTFDKASWWNRRTV